MEKEDFSLRKFLEKQGISKIFIDNTISLDEIIKGIKDDKNNDNLALEIEKLKQIIEEKKYYKVDKKEKYKSRKIKKESENKVIAMAGNYGSGKSLITAELGKAGEQLKYHTIIVDFDIINNSINMLFKIPKYNLEQNRITDFKQCIHKVSEYLDIFCGVDLLFNETNKISYEKVKNLFEDLKNKYDLILVDTSSETALKYVKTILLNSDKILFLIEPNLLDIKKSERLLEVYIEDWEIPINKFNIVLNKANSASIDDGILVNIFEKIKVIAKINFSTVYTVFANDFQKRKFNFK